MIDSFIQMFSYSFMVRALITGLFISACASVIGVNLVLNHFSMMGDGLSHVAFGALAIATIFNLTNRMIIVLPITIVFAILLLRKGQNAKIKGDAAIAMLSVGALAFGYMLMNLFPSSSNVSGDVCTTLFGSMSILMLTKTDVWVCGILAIIVTVLFIILYNRIFAVTFDEDFANAVGTKVNFYNLLIATVIAVIIVLAMNLVGSLLISALVIFPALSAMSILKNFKSVTIFSAISSMLCALLGILISILAGTPVGSTIVACDVALFGICYLIGRIRG